MLFYRLLILLLLFFKINFFGKFFRENYQIAPDLIWFQTVSTGYQQTTLVAKDFKRSYHIMSKFKNVIYFKDWGQSNNDIIRLCQKELKLSFYKHFWNLYEQQLRFIIITIPVVKATNGQ